MLACPLSCLVSFCRETAARRSSTAPLRGALWARLGNKPRGIIAALPSQGSGFLSLATETIQGSAIKKSGQGYSHGSGRCWMRRGATGGGEVTRVLRWRHVGATTVPEVSLLLRPLSNSPGNSCLAVKMGWAIPFLGESFAGGAGGAACPPALNQARCSNRIERRRAPPAPPGGSPQIPRHREF